MADATENDPKEWPEVTKALESYKDVEVRNWTRELVLQKKEMDERLFRCHPLTELTIVVPNLDNTLGPVGFLKNLVNLVVRDCGLSEIPRSIARCKALKNLDASNNPQLTYLPEELRELPHLDSVRACECAIDTIRDLEGCDRISQLFLNKNLLTELDGPTLGSMTHLIHLEASENAIDEIPAEIANLAKSLQVLDVHDNAITAIPQAFGALKKLVRINFSGNVIENKQTLRVVKDATEHGAKKLKNFIVHAKKKGVKTKPLKGKRPKFVRVTKEERLAAEKAAAEAAAAAAAAAAEAADGSAPETKESDGADGWGEGGDAGEWGAAEGGGKKAESVVDPKETARQARRQALIEKRKALQLATDEGRRAAEEEAERLQKQREAEREAQLKKQEAEAALEAEMEEKRRQEEEAEQARFDALPEDEKARILAERAEEAAKEEARRLQLVAEAKARNDAIAAKEQAREAAKKADEKRAQEQALKAQEAAAKSAMEANRRHLGSVMKFIPEKKFGFILDETTTQKLFFHIDNLMHEAQSVSVQAHKRRSLAVGTQVEYIIDPPRGRQPLGKAQSISLPGFKPFPLVFS